MCLFEWSKGHVIMKYVVIVIPLIEFDICNSKIWEVIFIGDNTSLLYYKQQFIGSLHVVDSRSRT